MPVSTPTSIFLLSSRFIAFLDIFTPIPQRHNNLGMSQTEVVIFPHKLIPSLAFHNSEPGTSVPPHCPSQNLNNINLTSVLVRPFLADLGCQALLPPCLHSFMLVPMAFASAKGLTTSFWNYVKTLPPVLRLLYLDYTSTEEISRKFTIQLKILPVTPLPPLCPLLSLALPETTCLSLVLQESIS